MLWLLLAVIATPAAAQTFPPLSGEVVDAANVLPPAVEADLKTKLQALRHDTKRQLVVATIPDLQGYELADYGYRLGRSWGVGLRDVDNGIILFIAPNEPRGHRGPRIEVGYSLEPIVTDALAKQVIDDKMMPQLAAGDVPGAMVAGTDALIAQLRAAPDEAKARTDAASAAYDRAHRTQVGQGGGLPLGLIFWVVVLLVVILPMLRGSRRQRRWRGGGSNWPVVLWSLADGLGQSRGGSGWSGGGWGGGSSGGGGSGGGWTGGFSGGGGGSFGGGGASGSW